MVAELWISKQYNVNSAHGCIDFVATQLELVVAAAGNLFFVFAT